MNDHNELHMLNSFKDCLYLNDCDSFVNNIYDLIINCVRQLLFIYGISRNYDKDIVYELTHDTLIRLLENIGRYKDREIQNIRTFIKIYTQNTVIDNLKRKTIYASYDPVTIKYEEIAYENLFESKLINKLTINKALKKLNPTERKIITLLYFGDYSAKEVSKKLKISTSTVYKKKIYALNQLRHYLPIELTKKGKQSLNDYFRQIEEKGTDYLYEAKLLIVGEPGAGKTTLAKKIDNPNYVLTEREPSTEGIEVVKWKFPIENNQVFNVNIWDFGGQEIYHATHQFFLTKRSLYTLVADTRKEDTDFYYWLYIVELLSEKSPLLIIKNEKHDRHREINERQLRGQFSSYKDSISVNLASNRGLNKVYKDIKHYISKLPHVGNPLPKTWVLIRNKLENDERNYISINDYLHICDKNGIELLKDKLQLSGYLHDIGVCLHFKDDPILKNIVILKPEWGTEAVYKVLDNKIAVKNNGKFTKDDLLKIWHEKKYEGMQDELLQLMIKFQLCYELAYKRGEYITPQLLSVNSPSYEWVDTNNLILKYTYDFMPKGIVIRFIVVMHAFIYKQKYVWKTGVILYKDSTKAEIIEFYDRREIKIRISGFHKKDLLTIVLHELDKIHSTYRDLKYDKMIPCNCIKCKDSQVPHFYSYKILQKFIKDQIDTIQCLQSYDMVSVHSMIDDIMFDSKETDANNTETKKIFISYSHKDEDWKDRLFEHLSVLQQTNLFEVWEDRKIMSGEEWFTEIQKALNTSCIAVLLISVNFLNSKFIQHTEIPILLNKRKKEGLRIIPVIIKPCVWKYIPWLSALSLFPKDGKPLCKYKSVDQEELFVDIANMVYEFYSQE